MYNQRAFKHGGYEDHLYDIWQDIKMRCSWPEHRLYHNNGARGVKVHDDWLNDYATTPYSSIEAVVAGDTIKYKTYEKEIREPKNLIEDSRSTIIAHDIIAVTNAPYNQ